MHDQQQRLAAILLADAWYLDVIRAARDAGLPGYAIAGGFVRNAVWDDLHGFTGTHRPADIDVAYFDPDDTHESRDPEIRALLTAKRPDLDWEPSNQAAVHLRGIAAHPLPSLEAALATWPETVTSIGVRLETDDTLAVIAPFGLDDLFEMKLRRNPACLTRDRFRDRVARKRIRYLWPLASIVDS